MITIYPKNFIDINKYQTGNVNVYEDKKHKNAKAFVDESQEDLWQSFRRLYGISSQYFWIGHSHYDPVSCRVYEVSNAKNYLFVAELLTLNVRNVVFFSSALDLYDFIDEMKDRIEFLSESGEKLKRYEALLKEKKKKEEEENTQLCLESLKKLGYVCNTCGNIFDEVGPGHPVDCEECLEKKAN